MIRSKNFRNTKRKFHGFVFHNICPKIRQNFALFSLLFLMNKKQKFALGHLQNDKI
jgi:hypothetical protein